MPEFMKTKLYFIFTLLIIIPCDIYIMKEDNFYLGLILLLMNIPYLLKYIKDEL